jgi:hypothetical protein
MEDVTVPMSDLPKSDGSNADSFVCRIASCDARFGMAEHQHAPYSNHRDLWLRIVAMVCSVAIHLALLSSFIRALSWKPTDARSDQNDATRLQLHFIEIALPRPSRPDASRSITPQSARRQPRLDTPGPVHARRVNPTPASLAGVRVSIAQGNNASARSDSWIIESLDKRTADDDARGYIRMLPSADANVMKHGNGGVTYHATRFESSWAPDRENPVSEAIERATLRATIALPHGLAVDCSGGPSSSEALVTSVPVIPLASMHCRGAPTPVPGPRKPCSTSRRWLRSKRWRGKPSLRRLPLRQEVPRMGQHVQSRVAQASSRLLVVVHGRCQTQVPVKVSHRHRQFTHQARLRSPSIERSGLKLLC